MKNESTKEVLLDAFTLLMSELGAHQVTLQKVAKKAKVPFSSAHYYYGGDWDLIFKDAVLKAGKNAQEYIASYIKKNTNAHSNPVELYVKGTFQWVLDHQNDARLWLFNYYFSSLRKEFMERQQEFIQVAQERVLQLLFEAKGRGIYASELKVNAELAQLVYSIVFAQWLMAMSQSIDAKNVNTLKKQALSQLNLILVSKK